MRIPYLGTWLVVWCVLLVHGTPYCGGQLGFGLALSDVASIAAPSDIVATPGPGRVTVSWSWPVGSPVDEFHVNVSAAGTAPLDWPPVLVPQEPHLAVVLPCDQCGVACHSAVVPGLENGAAYQAAVVRH